jgi:hypothetical protein
MAVLDIVAKGVEIDFAGVEFNLGRAPQPAGVIDDAHDLQRRRGTGAVLPHAKGFERRDGTAEQSGGAVVGGGRTFAHQHGGDTAFSQRNRRGEAGWPAADHDGRRFFVRAVNLVRVWSVHGR